MNVELPQPCLCGHDRDEHKDGAGRCNDVSPLDGKCACPVFEDDPDCGCRQCGEPAPEDCALCNRCLRRVAKR